MSKGHSDRSRSGVLAAAAGTAAGLAG
jgi:hypothetical protein